MPAVAKSPSVRAPDGLTAAASFDTEVAEFFGEAADLLGVPRSLAAIYAAVFASPQPLSFAEITGRVGLSKGSVSQGLRTLREIGAVKEVSTSRDKAELFEPDLEMRRLIARYLANRLEPQMKAGQERLERLNRGLTHLPADTRKSLAPRLEKLRSWHNRSSKLVPLIRTFLRIT